MENKKKILIIISIIMLVIITGIIILNNVTYAYMTNEQANTIFTGNAEIKSITNYHITTSDGSNYIISLDELNTVCSKGGTVVDNNGTLIQSGRYQEICDVYLNLTPPPPTNYTGYYASLDGQTIAGVIFFDYMFGADTTKGFLGLGVAVSPITEGLNTYTLETVAGHENVVVPTSTDKQDRFYVIALENVKPISGSNYAYWYYSAYLTKISDYNTVTSTAFGSGKSNTQTMKSKWDSQAYGAKNNGDMFTINMGDWFVPSIDEWLVLGSNLKKVATGTYSSMSFESGASLGFPSSSWSSSLISSEQVPLAYFSQGTTLDYTTRGNCYVRLATTF